jgi:hypothetical protein
MLVKLQQKRPAAGKVMGAAIVENSVQIILNTDIELP